MKQLKIFAAIAAITAIFSTAYAEEHPGKFLGVDESFVMLFTISRVTPKGIDEIAKLNGVKFMSVHQHFQDQGKPEKKLSEHMKSMPTGNVILSFMAAKWLESLNFDEANEAKGKAIWEKAATEMNLTLTEKFGITTPVFSLKGNLHDFERMAEQQQPKKGAAN